jgi:aryl-alcohol dehydrogenase-like predicted oxidoreductase
MEYRSLGRTGLLVSPIGVRQGKVRYIGTSVFPAWKLMEGLAISERYNLARYVSEQPPYNLLDRRIENELVPMAQAHGIGIIPWSPIAGGVLGGRYQAGRPLPEDSRAARQGERYQSDRIKDRPLQIAQRMIDLAVADFFGNSGWSKPLRA